MKRSLFLIRIASLLVPAAQRAEWSREWLGELHHAGALDLDDARLLSFARGSFRDALWHRQWNWSREELAAQTQSARFCLASLAALIVLIAGLSGFLPITRSIVLPLPYRDADRLALASHGGGLNSNYALHGDAVLLWQSKSRLVDGAAAYSWKNDGEARVSDNFFFLLGARTVDGHRFSRDELADCGDCVVLSYRYWQSALKGSAPTPNTRVTLDGHPHRVAAVLERPFWFLSRDIAVWRVMPPASLAEERVGAVVRLGTDVTTEQAERELSSILMRAQGGPGWSSLVQVAMLPGRVREVFGSYGLSLGLALVIAAASSRVRLPKWNPRGALFFVAKTSLLLMAVFLAGLEFAQAYLVTVFSTWLFLLASMLALVWSVRDQQARCRVCLRRLGLPTRVGCPGCLLLDWAGTELVCVEGHGMLHVPEMVSCWHEPEHWTALDESWQGLFERT